MKKPHVLVVFPHPDDETFGPGGSLILHSKQGTPITYLCGTLGEMGRQMGSPITANRETLPLIRKRELEEACKVLGITDLRLMGYHDKTVEFEDREELTEKIYQAVIELQPTIVYTYYPGHAVHPDHEAMAEATIAALARLPLEERPVLYCLAFSINHRQVLGEPDMNVDISSVAQEKLQAIKAHYTQTALTISRYEAALAHNDTEFIGNRLQLEQYYTYKW